MKQAFFIIAALLVLTGVAGAQFKSDVEKQPSASESMVRPAAGFGNLLGLLNSDNFRMRQNVSFSFLSSGGTGMSLASYTSSMFYKIADPLNVRFDLTLQGSPFGGASSPYQQALSGLFLSRAELSYRPWENVFIKLEYSHLPGFYSQWSDPWYSPWGLVSNGGNQ